MQLVFTVEEFRVLIHVLRECDTLVKDRPKLLRSSALLLDRLLAREFSLSADELEDLNFILHLADDKLTRTMAKTPERLNIEEARRDAVLLGRLIERVTEACAMA